MTTATFYVNNDSVVYDDTLHMVSVVNVVAKRLQIALVTKSLSSVRRGKSCAVFNVQHQIYLIRRCKIVTINHVAF